MLYRPSSSVTPLRIFSIKAGLAASTVTPGSTAPDVSLTTPAIPLAVPRCADATPGSSSADTRSLSPTQTWPFGSMPSPIRYNSPVLNTCSSVVNVNDLISSGDSRAGFLWRPLHLEFSRERQWRTVSLGAGLVQPRD